MSDIIDITRRKGGDKMENLPELLERVKARLEVVYYESSKKNHEILTEEFKTLPKDSRGFIVHKAYDGFMNKYGYRVYERYVKYWTDEDAKKDAHSKAESDVKRLYLRIEKITGSKIAACHLRFNNGELNGTVKGTEGTANVNTIIAGGYNIQCRHFRTLVKKIG